MSRISLAPPRGVAKMYQQPQPTPEIAMQPPPLPSLDEQERLKLRSDVEAIERQNAKCRREIDDKLADLCKRRGGTA